MRLCPPVLVVEVGDGWQRRAQYGSLRGSMFVYDEDILAVRLESQWR